MHLRQVLRLVAPLGLLNQLLVDAHLLRHLQVVGHFDHEHAVDHRLVLLVGEVGVVFVLVGVGDYDDIGVDEREPPDFDHLLARDGVQLVEEPLVRLEHLDKLHKSAVGFVEFAVEVVDTRVGLDADLCEQAQVHAACQFGDILRLGVGGLEGADACALAFGELDAHDGHILDVFAPLVAQFPLAHGAQVALDMHAELALEIGAQLFGHQMQRLLVHGAVLDGVDRAVVRARVALQPTLEHRHQRRLAAAHRSDQQQDALAHIEPPRSRREIFLYQLLQGALQAEQLGGEEFVFAWLPLAALFDARANNHIVHARVREVRHLRVPLDNLQVVPKCAFPSNLSLQPSLFLDLAQEIGCAHTHRPPCALRGQSGRVFPRRAFGVPHAVHPMLKGYGDAPATPLEYYRLDAIRIAGVSDP
jgi:hypothetical protein